MSPGIPAASMRCEYRANPLGIDVPHPRFGWTVHSAASLPRGRRQVVYQILAASSPRLLDDDRGDLFDTGKIESPQMSHIPYLIFPRRPACA